MAWPSELCGRAPRNPRGDLHRSGGEVDKALGNAALNYCDDFSFAEVGTYVRWCSGVNGTANLQ